MKRFNLLVVNGNGKSNAGYSKMLKKVGRRNFVIEVGSMEEANSLLETLDIDLILMDLDQSDTSVKAFQAKCPDVYIIGASNKRPSSAVHAPSERFRVLPKSELSTAFPAELKAIRKGTAKGSKFGFGTLRAITRSDFKNFNQLVTSN